VRGVRPSRPCGGSARRAGWRRCRRCARRATPGCCCGSGRRRRPGQRGCGRFQAASGVGLLTLVERRKDQGDKNRWPTSRACKANDAVRAELERGGTGVQHRAHPRRGPGLPSQRAGGSRPFVHAVQHVSLLSALPVSPSEVVHGGEQPPWVVAYRHIHSKACTSTCRSGAPRAPTTPRCTRC